MDIKFAKVRADLDPLSLVYVADDDKNSKWYFHKPDMFYYRLDSGGKWFRRVSMKNLENPDDLWNLRIKRYPQADPKTLKPCDCVYKLWEHKKAYIANGE